MVIHSCAVSVYDRNSYIILFYCCKTPAEILPITEGEITVFTGLVSFDATGLPIFGVWRLTVGHAVTAVTMPLSTY